MNFTMRMEGVESLKRKFQRHPEALEEEVLTVMKQEARTLALEYGYNTAPVGFEEGGPADKARERIRGEVERMFPSSRFGEDGINASGVYEVLHRHDPKLAKLFWRAHKQGDVAAMEKLLRKRGLPRGIDREAYELRRSPRGGLNKGAEAIALTTPGRQGSYAKERQKRVGLAKAGWLQAAQAIGGRVRRGGRAAFPKYVRALARKETGLGGAVVTGGGRIQEIRIFTRVRYGDRALPDARYRRANDVAEERFAKSLRIRLQHVNRKTFNGRKVA